MKPWKAEQAKVESSQQLGLYMKKSTFSEAQIVGTLDEVEMDEEIGKTCRKHGISAPTYDKWMRQSSGTTVSRRLSCPGCRVSVLARFTLRYRCGCT